MVHLHVYAEEKTVKQFKEGYMTDKDFLKLVEHTNTEGFNERKYRAYRVAGNGLLYFKDADSQLRLCIPKTERNKIL